MKVEPFLVASTVNVIIAQRLVRRICDTCRSRVEASRDDLIKGFGSELATKYFPDVTKDKAGIVYKGKGCRVCGNSGYIGRLGLFEVLEVTKKIIFLIF